jgi:hypothetical protein
LNDDISPDSPRSPSKRIFQETTNNFNPKEQRTGKKFKTIVGKENQVESVRVRYHYDLVESILAKNSKKEF